MIKGILFDFGDTIIVEHSDLSIPILECQLRTVRHAPEVLSRLSSEYKLAIVSNTFTSGDEQISEALRRVDLLKYFSAVVTSVTVGSAKPDAGIYREALRRLELKEDQVVMVGDRVDTDILGANRLGIKSVLHRWNDRYAPPVYLPEHEPTARIQSLVDLEGIIRSFQDQPAGKEVLTGDKEV